MGASDLSLTWQLAGRFETRAQFEAEPTAYRWIFERRDAIVAIRVLELSHGRLHDNAGAEVWSSRQPMDRLSRTVIRCFDAVADAHGESACRGAWGARFPRTELEALRGLWRTTRS
ncbi:hypothetical protein AB0M28_19555 [Streptomyces sp. NPDC051940]|uniref:hypothetical protein n=1 Tax=Streptomyces sp. NPDC051940 TaxID=3155675 RepID=UPI003433CE44